MARNKGKATAGGKKAGGGTAAKTSVKSKKDKNVFKVADAKHKKKPKEVEGKLKKIKETVKNSQKKLDADLKDLHKDLVVKKPKASTSNTPIKKNKKAPANAKKVSQKLGNLKV